MQKILLLLVVLMSCVIVTSAQEAKQEQPAKKGCSCAFSSIIQGGILHGSRGGYFQAQTIHGIRYKTWFAGLGAGLDYYYRPGFPLFVDLRKNILDKPGALFLYADAGVHLPAKRKETINAWVQNEYSNSFYGDGGVGYAFGFHSNVRWVFSTGYSYKEGSYKVVNPGSGCTGPPCGETYSTYKKYFHRLTVKLGFQF